MVGGGTAIQYHKETVACRIRGVIDVTDLAVRPNSDTSTAGATTAVDAETAAIGDETPPVEWAAAEPSRKPRRWLWWAIPTGVVVAGLTTASLILIAPGTSIGGVPVGFHTAGAAAGAIEDRLAATTLVISGPDGEAQVSAADLGASVNARTLADSAHAAHPMWNIGSWNSEPQQALVSLDPEVATAALKAAAPSLYTDPVDAVLAFTAESGTYVVTPAVPGTGIDLDTVRAALNEAFAAGTTTVPIEAVEAPIRALTPTYVADAVAGRLNGILSKAGFYVGEERTVPVEPAVAATWLTVTPGERGTFDVAVNEAPIQAFVDGLPARVDRAPVNAVAITDSSGDVLRSITDGVTGRTLESTAGIADAYAKQLATGNAVYQLPVTEVPFTTAGTVRTIEADLGAQMIYLKENGTVVDSWAVSSGTGASPTTAGSYRIGWKTEEQTMRGLEVDGNGNTYIDPATGELARYEQPNVKWAMYFNGDEAFHGVYWHNNFGTPMSHGCIGMPEYLAEYLFGWAPQGVEVEIYY